MMNSENEIPSGFENTDTLTEIATTVRVKSNTEAKPLRNHVVLLHDSPAHTDMYVVEVCLKVCNMNMLQAIEAVKSIVTDGRAVVYSGHKELCELKAEQIISFGGDKYAQQAGHESVGAMTVTVEPS
jgi:hypothetical protein